MTAGSCDVILLSYFLGSEGISCTPCATHPRRPPPDSTATKGIVPWEPAVYWKNRAHLLGALLLPGLCMIPRVPLRVDPLDMVVGIVMEWLPGVTSNPHRSDVMSVRGNTPNRLEAETGTTNLAHRGVPSVAFDVTMLSQKALVKMKRLFLSTPLPPASALGLGNRACGVVRLVDYVSVGTRYRCR